MPQESLTVSSGLFEICHRQAQFDWVLPWEVEGFSFDFIRGERVGGFFDLSHWGVVEISGPDATDYLNRMSTLDFKHWNTAQTRLGAFLTGRSGVVCLGFFQSAGKEYHLLVAPPQRETALQHIEQFHFAEQMEVLDRSKDWAVFGVWKQTPGISTDTIQWRDPFQPLLTCVKIRRPDAMAFLEQLKSQGVSLLGNRLFEFYRRQSGLARVGVEIDSSVMILEAGLEAAVDRDKGCYPGQEVVERIFTYGQVNRKLFPVVLSGAWREATLPLKFTKNERPAGVVVALDEHPGKGDCALGLAFVYRPFWEDAEGFQESGTQIDRG